MVTRATPDPTQETGPRRRWWPLLGRARVRMKTLNVSLLAAGVAFWATLSIFPMLIALVMVYGLVANPADVERQIDHALSGLSPDAKSLVGNQVAAVAATRSGALSLGLVLSVVVLLWTASSGAQNFMKAVTIAFEQQETRGFLRQRGTALLLAVAAIVLGVVLVALVGVVPAVIRHVLSSPGLTWLVLAIEGLLLLLVLWAVVAALYRFAPASRPPGWRRTSMGSLLAAVVIVAFSVLFALYVNTFGTYQKTYGTLAGAIVLMLWLYYSAYVLLVGALVDAEAARVVDGAAVDVSGTPRYDRASTDPAAGTRTDRAAPAPPGSSR
jgi:membrane protein